MNNFSSILLFAAKKASNVPSDASEVNFTWILIAVSIAALGILGYLVYTYFKKIESNSHFALFHGLCHLHNLDSNSKRILRNLSLHYQIEKPVTMFLEPSWLEKARSENAFPEDSELITALSTKLFG